MGTCWPAPSPASCFVNCQHLWFRPGRVDVLITTMLGDTKARVSEMRCAFTIKADLMGKFFNTFYIYQHKPYFTTLYLLCYQWIISLSSHQKSQQIFKHKMSENGASLSMPNSEDEKRNQRFLRLLRISSGWGYQGPSLS